MTVARTGAGPKVVHVVVGPAQHGVVRHGTLVARAGGEALLRRDSAASVTEAASVDLTADVVHLAFTDRLFGARAEESATAFEAMVAPWRAAGVPLSVTLHDLPGDDSAWDRRRAAAYRRVITGAAGVVVNSCRELELVESLIDSAAPPRSLRCIPLPLEPAVPDDHEPVIGSDVVVLGFLFPDRGYEHTIAELPPGVDLVALGRPSAGHDDLPAELAALATAAGHTMITTGFVPDADLGRALRSAGVPVAPNRRVAASASINTWIAHGRRPLVPDAPYTRELDLRTPGTVTRYDADEPGALRTAIAAALADPARTRLSDDVVTAPSVAEVADQYRRHFAGCVRPSAIRLDDRHLVVPDNRWDLVAGLTPEPPTVSVVIPHFEAQRRLDLVLTALTLQTHPSDRLQIVVADDGSARPPSVTAAGRLAARVVRQADAGFRAAAARNLGAAAAEGEVLLFLDGDTVPEPDYVARLARLPALLPDALTVGRRRHADLGGWDPERLTTWLTGGPGPDVLDEPGWLADAYAGSADLLRADHRSYRYVISAVLGMSRDLFGALGGFGPEFEAYGGEDWELAHRAWVGGAVLAHVPDAVAWHDGPDWAGRDSGAVGAKNRETLTLARLLPDPEARGGGQWGLPAVAAVLGFAEPAAVLATARALFTADADVGVWVDHPTAAETVAALADPRIHAAPVPVEVRRRVQATLRLDAPARVTDVPGLMRMAGRHGPLTLPTGELVPGRAARRAARWADRLGGDADLLAARLFGGRDLPGPLPSAPVDLAHELKYVYAATRSPAPLSDEVKRS